MWTCPKCQRIFQKEKQMHSCRKVPLDQHFKNKPKAKELFDLLVKLINQKIGRCQIISLPCCIHLFGHYDFLAALPKKDRLEIRFSLNQSLNYPRIKQAVRLSANDFKNCLDLTADKQINAELIGWLDKSYHFKEVA